MRIVVLTGAGISAESGLPTFRDADGLWEGHRPEDVATPEAYRRPCPGAPLLRRTAGRAGRGRRAQRRPPRAGPARGGAWATTCSSSPRTSTTCTSVAGRRGCCTCTGSCSSARCVPAATRRCAGPATSATPALPDLRRGRAAAGRGVVRRGALPAWTEVVDALEGADLFVLIGTSGVVYPAAGLRQYAARPRRHAPSSSTSSPARSASRFHDVPAGPRQRAGADVGRRAARLTPGCPVALRLGEEAVGVVRRPGHRAKPGGVGAEVRRARVPQRRVGVVHVGVVAPVSASSRCGSRARSSSAVVAGPRRTSRCTAPSPAPRGARTPCRRGPMSPTRPPRASIESPGLLESAGPSAPRATSQRRRPSDSGCVDDVGGRGEPLPRQ